MSRSLSSSKLGADSVTKKPRIKYDKRLSLAKPFLSRSEYTRIKKMPRKSAMNRLRKINEFTRKMGGEKVFKRTRSAVTKKRLNKISGFRGVFDNLNNQPVEQSRIIWRAHRKNKNIEFQFLEVIGGNTRQLFPVPSIHDEENIPDIRLLKNEHWRIYFNGRVILGHDQDGWIEMRKNRREIKPMIESHNRVSGSGRRFLDPEKNKNRDAVEFIIENIDYRPRRKPAKKAKKKKAVKRGR